LVILAAGFFFPLAYQFVHDADSGRFVRGESLLDGTDGLLEGLQPDAVGIFRENQFLAGGDAKVLPHVSWYDDAACRINPDTGDVRFMGLSHDALDDSKNGTYFDIA
jgi:hypothetical protein